MSDLYTEVLVKKQQTGKDKAIKGVLIFFTVLFAAAGIMMNPLILLLALVLGIVDYIFIPKLSVEFEYLYVNGELDIDRIYSQSRRKRAASYELSNMEILAPYQSHQLDSYKNNQHQTLQLFLRNRRTGSQTVCICYFKRQHNADGHLRAG